MSVPTQPQSMTPVSSAAPVAVGSALQPVAMGALTQPVAVGGGTQQPVQASRKHQPLMDLDCHRLRNLDPHRPFSGMQDAVERLLPFHVFAAADPSEADAAQAAAENLQVTAGRRDAWDRQQAQAAFELADRIDKLAEQVRQVKARMDSGAASQPEDQLALERHLHADAHARLEALKRQRAQQAQEEASRRAQAAAASTAQNQLTQEHLTLI